MPNQFTKSKPIVAAVRLDSSDHAVLAAARHLSKKLHAPLELVHAVRPMFSYVGSGDIVVNPYYGYEMNFADNEERAAKTKISNLVQSLDDVSVRAHVVRDFPTEALLTFAHEIDASLIVCGVTHKEPNRFLSGLSTGFALASDSDIPVLLVPPEPINFGIPLRILVADNLESEGEEALRAGMQLANELHAEQLTHVHIQDTTLADIDAMIESVRESMIMGHIPSDSLLNRDQYIERLRAQTREALIRRCQGIRENELNATRYDAVMSFGHPSEEVHNELLRSGSQIMIFGRHHILRRKTLSLGRIPYHAMIEDGVATLVVPDGRPVGLETRAKDRRSEL